MLLLVIMVLFIREQIVEMYISKVIILWIMLIYLEIVEYLNKEDLVLHYPILPYFLLKSVGDLPTLGSKVSSVLLLLCIMI